MDAVATDDIVYALRCKADLSERDNDALRARGKRLEDLLSEELRLTAPSEDEPLCWRCGADVNGKRGPKEPHRDTCWCARVWGQIGR